MASSTTDTADLSSVGLGMALLLVLSHGPWGPSIMSVGQGTRILAAECTYMVLQSILWERCSIPEMQKPSHHKWSIFPRSHVPAGI